jgi:hypothetical protein
MSLPFLFKGERRILLKKAKEEEEEEEEEKKGSVSHATKILKTLDIKAMKHTYKSRKKTNFATLQH